MKTSLLPSSATVPVAPEEALGDLLLDTLPFGTIVADKTRRVLFANAMAQDILAAADGLSLSDGRLQAARAFETNALTAHLRAAALRAPHDTTAALLVARPSGKPPLALLIAPLLAVREADDIAAARMAVFLTDLEAADRDGRINMLAPRLTQLFGLSKAEARVAANIVEGRRLPEIARDCDVRMPTVRTQLRAALSKIGVARQADMVRVALSLPAIGSGPAALVPAPRRNGSNRQRLR